jgi:MFS family permease
MERSKDRLVTSVAAITGIVAQTPAGALVDATKAKRVVMVGAALFVTLASLLLPLFPNFWPVAISQGIAHAAGVVFPPAIAAVSLGVVGHSGFTARIGRNETFNHAGNAVAATIAGAAAYLFGLQSCSICSRPCRSPVSSAYWRYREKRSTMISPAACTMWSKELPPARKEARRRD